jgi:hypothetical protein
MRHDERLDKSLPLNEITDIINILTSLSYIHYKKIEFINIW